MDDETGTHSTLTIGIITDIHHGRRAYYRGVLRKLGDQALGLTRAFVDQMNRSIQPDLVVHLGDAIKNKDARTDRRLYAEVMGVLGELTAPVLHVIGNHDEVYLAEAELRRLHGLNAIMAPFESKGHQVLALASHGDDNRCWVDAAALDQLTRQLHSSQSPALLFVHHALDEQDLRGNPWFEGQPELCLIENRRSIRDLLSRHPRVRAVFQGHLHWNQFGVHGGRPYFTLHSVVENIAPDNAPPLATGAWSVVEVRRGGLTVRVMGNAPAGWEWEG